MTTYAPPFQIILPWTAAFAEDNGAGAAWTRLQSSGQLGGGIMYSGLNAASGNYVDYRVALGVGTYTFTAIGLTNSFYGISTVSLTDSGDTATTLGTLDWYGGAVNAVVKTITGISITTAGVYKLRLISTTKNASATFYSQGFNLLALHRTDDASGPIVGGTLPHRVDIIPWAGTTYAAAPGLSAISQSSAILGGGYRNAGATIDNYAEWMVPLAAGTWTITQIGFQNTDAPIVTPSLNGVALSTTNWYGANAGNTVKTTTGITVAQDGIYKLRFTATDKDASSSGYINRFIHLILQRTGA